ncbi:Na+/H+ antiporter subunit E [Sedimentitalea sp. JM2-8]|uniref:Na+/H+ antiporter subunit E n=1 Tax=Sedimentitalea xiamensis TaxID=3050037 RepID=A0ABT7FDJ8_9RHOB|nr:Na+/H+ antiporter subunit E [Sedimentitalea xiamensis]MDK3072899.1 Na+/H+ antiporter subunit E [Sedimentitalea xiamensis]
MSKRYRSDEKNETNGFWGAWVTFFVIWMAVTASTELARMAAGLIVSFGIAILASRMTDFWDGFSLKPRQLAAGLRYLAVFMREIVKSNISVMGYVYSPRVNISPVTMHVSTRLARPRERLALTNTLTLTPGSLVIDLEDERIHLHLLDSALVAGTEGSVREFETLVENAIG